MISPTVTGFSLARELLAVDAMMETWEGVVSTGEARARARVKVDALVTRPSSGYRASQRCISFLQAKKESFAIARRLLQPDHSHNEDGEDK